MGVPLRRMPVLGFSVAIATVGLATNAAARIVEADGVQAEYTEDDGEFCIESPQLTITRDGAPSYDAAIASELGICQQEERFDVRDLDQDGEPEVVIDFYSGGAHCCWFTQVYRYDGDQVQYSMAEQYWGNGGSAPLEDLEGDGQPEFVSRDDRFAYQFASYADSAYPPQIWRYDGSEGFVDVTRQYPDRVYDEAYGLWQRYEQIRAEGRETKGALAAYLATKYLLDQAEDGWQRVQTAYQGGDRPQFLADLSTFLQQTGYTTAAASPGMGSTSAGSTSASDASVLLEQQGSLDSGDSILPTDGSLYDEHQFVAEEGDVVLIRLESDVFDPYLFLVGPQGELIAQNDDVSESDTTALLVLTLPQTGPYRAIANSYDSTGRGGYQLTIRRRPGGSDADDGDADAVDVEDPSAEGTP
ncbi:MAG: hypothetical protein WBA10_13870 [Elainellaceae cyanobacterium]